MSSRYLIWGVVFVEGDCCELSLWCGLVGLQLRFRFLSHSLKVFYFEFPWAFPGAFDALSRSIFRYSYISFFLFSSSRRGPDLPISKISALVFCGPPGNAGLADL